MMGQCGLCEWGRRTLPDAEKAQEIERDGRRVGIQRRHTTKGLGVSWQRRTTAVQRCSFLAVGRPNVLGDRRLHSIKVGADLEVL